jgi:uncharacterized protein (DUF169 family)
MSADPPASAAQFVYDDLRLKTLPVGVSFLKDKADIPDGARRPALHLKKRVTVCQVMTMARNYGWQMAVTEEDLVCPLAALAFGFSSSLSPVEDMAEAFLTSQYKSGADKSLKETAQMCFFEKGVWKALFVSPLRKMDRPADVIVLYGNPAQISRLVQAATYDMEERIQGLFGGKVECPEYLIRPMVTGKPRVVLPGPGDRIFSMTGDDEMIFAFPYSFLNKLTEGLRESGKRVGARYPITFYQNFQPEFPKHYQELAKKLGLWESCD